MAKSDIVDPKEITALLRKTRGVKVKSVSGNTMTLMVEGSRLDKMSEVSKILSGMGAVIDSNLKGSSIGGIKIGNFKILFKAAGRTNGLDVETGAINALSAALLSAISVDGGPITIKIGARAIRGVASVIKTPGTPKSDFFLADKQGNPLIHISHKKGSKPTDFQQWGGITEDRIFKHPEVIQFGISTQKLYGDQMPNAESAYAEIKDKKLKLMAVFGVEFDSSSINENRVDVLIQGDPGLKKVSGGYQLTATGHIHYRPELPSGEFDPIFAVIYKGDRSQFGIKGARVSIYPSGGRRFKTRIK